MRSSSVALTSNSGISIQCLRFASFWHKFGGVVYANKIIPKSYRVHPAHLAVEYYSVGGVVAGVAACIYCVCCAFVGSFVYGTCERCR
jgi:hypothetical protein